MTDHLGSVRVIVDGTGKVLERNDYYPFGARHARSDYPQVAVNRYKYNGKEEQVTGDLGYLDYGARMYDSGLGRWFCKDPLLERSVSWTPYRYGFNNPVRCGDVAGLWEKTSNGWSTNDHNDISRLLSMIEFETSMFGGVSEAQYYLFIQEEYDGIGGRLSDGSILLSELQSLKRKNGDWLYSPHDQNVILNEMNKFGEQMMESNILSSGSLYTYKYYREKSWEQMKAKFPVEAITGYACGVVSEKLWGNNNWLNLNNMKSYSTRFYGNQYFSSGQVKTWKNVAKFASGGLRWIGKGLGAYG
ncbi:RHS repeat domain-containing protein, partial [Butyricimonas paravirosa]